MRQRLRGLLVVFRDRPLPVLLIGAGYYSELCPFAHTPLGLIPDTS